jgi:hypothetical protein
MAASSRSRREFLRALGGVGTAALAGIPVRVARDGPSPVVFTDVTAAA